MERSQITPHLSWSGPQPDREIDAYLLAMLLRVHAAGLDLPDDEKRDPLLHPSVLTTNNLHLIAVMYAFYKEKMDEAGARNTEAMLKLIKDSEDETVAAWLPGAEGFIRKAEEELIDYVETPGNPGFTSFG
jgi:hypothetical protein